MALHAITVSVSPTSLTNDYFGKVTLTIGGFPAGGTVTVDRFADLNGNGFIDPSVDVLLQSFTVTDGQVPLLAGVRNLNLPGDEDGAVNAQLRVELPWPGLNRTLNFLEGNHVFRVRYLSQTATTTLTVRQKSLPQWVTGQVFDLYLYVPLPNTLVLLLDAKGKGLGSTKTDAAGRYTLRTPPGDYQIWAIRSGYYSDQYLAWALVATNSLTTNDLYLYPGTYALAGRLADSNGNGLPGVLTIGLSSGGYFAGDLTDATGRYTLRVDDDDWEIYASDEQLPALSCLAPYSVPAVTVSANTANVNFIAAAAHSQVYGTIRNAQSNAVAGVVINATDLYGQYYTTGESYSTNGNYSLGLTEGDWWIEPDNATLAPLGYLAAGTYTYLQPAQAVRLDFKVRTITAHLRGRVLNETNGVVAEALLVGTDTNEVYTTSTTDAAGNFDIPVYAGPWVLGLEADSAASLGVVGSVLSVTVTNGQTVSNLVFRVRHSSGQVTGSVLDTHGGPVAGTEVWGNTTNAGIVYALSSVTDTNGIYTAAAFPETWTVGLDCTGGNGLNLLGFDCIDPQGVTLAGTTATANFTVVPTPATPVLHAPTWQPGGVFSFRVSGPSGRTNVVESSDALPVFAPLLTTNPPFSPYEFRAPANRPQRFYRVRLP